LNPSYKLQSVAYMPPEPMRFVRDHINIEDIDGARPQRKRNFDYATRDIMKISDIDGAKPNFGHEIPERKEGYGLPYNYSQMDYRDVTHT